MFVVCKMVLHVTMQWYQHFGGRGSINFYYKSLAADVIVGVNWSEKGKNRERESKTYRDQTSHCMLSMRCRMCSSILFYHFTHRLTWMDCLKINWSTLFATHTHTHTQSWDHEVFSSHITGWKVFWWQNKMKLIQMLWYFTHKHPHILSVKVSKGTH